MFESIKRFVKNVLAAGHAGIDTHNPLAAAQMMKAAYPKNAFMAVLVGSIMAVVVGSVMLYVGLFASVTVYNAIPTGSLSAADNTTLADVKSNVNTAFTLLGIVLIVGGAGGIISVLLGFVR